MAETTIHKVCVRENQSGQFVYSFKPQEGYIFTDAPQIYTISGEEWDTTNNGPMTITYGNDYSEFYGDGTGVHGTETVTVTLSYNIPDLDPTDDNSNEIYINFFTKKIIASCLPTVEYIVFTGQGGSPRINGITPYTTYVGQNNYTGAYASGAVFLFAGMYQTTYDYYIDEEKDAFTLYSENPGITVTGSLSKSVFVSNNLYTGNVDMYWGNVAITITADFDKATMIFQDGFRSTYGWIRYQDSCAPNYLFKRHSFGTSKPYLSKIGDCEFVASSRAWYSPLYKSQEGNTYLWSTTNGYSFSKISQSRTIQNNDSTTSAIEPYGQLITRENTWISMHYSYNNSNTNTIPRISFDAGETWQTITEQNGDTAYVLYTYWNDIVYAGYDSNIENHVWYALINRNYSVYHENLIYKSVDDGATFNKVIWDGPNHSNDFEDIETLYNNGLDNFNRGRLWVDIDKDYIFVFLPRMVSPSTTQFSQWALFRGFLSEQGVGNGGEIRPVLARELNLGSPPTYAGVDFNYDDVLFMSSGPYQNMPLSISDNGMCLFTTQDKYAVSWNFGLNWTDTDLPTISQVHSVTGDTYVYPEKYPSPFYFNGRTIVITSHTDDSANYQNNVMTNNRLVNGVMEVKIKNDEGWFTGVVPQGWGDKATFGVPSGLTSSIIGPYDTNYGGDSIIYGSNILFHNARYDLSQDPNFGTYYWYSWDIVGQTTTSTGNSAAQTPAGLAPNRMVPYGNKILASGDVNGPVSAVDEDWVLFESTDGGTNFTPLYTHPDTAAYIYTINCEANGIDPFIHIEASRNPEFIYSFDSGATWNVLSNASAYTFYSSNPKFQYTDGYLWIMESRNYSSGRKSWILPANQTVMSDANNWAPYEVSQTSLAWSTSPVRQLAAYGQKGIIQHGDFHYYTTTDRGQTWTQMTSLTTTDNVTYTSSDFQTWSYGLDVNPYTGEFKLQVGGSSSLNYLLTYDFITWTPISYDPSDAEGDNNPNLEVQNIMPAPNGNWYALIREAYDSKPRLFNLSDSIATSPPTYDRLIDSWSVDQEYTYTDVDPATNPDYLSDGYYGLPIHNIYADYNQPDGQPRLYITRSYGLDVLPEPEAPTVVDGSSVIEISYPAYTDSANLNYDVAPGYVRRAEFYSQSPFTIVYVKYTGELVKLDGVFDIIVMSICDPVVIPSVSNQVINEGVNEDVLYDEASYASHGFDATWYLFNGAQSEDGHAVMRNVQRNVFYNIQDRADVPAKANRKTIQDLTTYVTDYTIPIPTSYTWNNVYVQENNPPDYGGRLIFFPPRGAKYINTIGVKLYADVYGTPYLDGYYLAEDIVTWFGSEGEEPMWFDIENNNYMLVKDGFVVETGNSKNLPDYDKC